MFLKGSRVPSWSQNRSKIDPRGYQKQDEILNGFWMALGSIFNRFWTQVGRQVEAKLESKSTKMALQKDVQKMITNLSPDLTQAHAVLGVGGPLKGIISRAQGTRALGRGCKKDPSRSRAARGGGYIQKKKNIYEHLSLSLSIYIYIYI